MFGRFFHLLVDAALISVALSGLRRTAGLSPAVARIPSKDVRNFLHVYLETGEWVRDLHVMATFVTELIVIDWQLMDFSIVVLGRSRYFDRIQQGSSR